MFQAFDERFKFVGTALSDGETQLCDGLSEYDGKPLIYISLGTIYNKHLSFFKSCIKEFANTEFTVFISVGTKCSIQSFSELPDNIYVYAHVDQKKILKKASLFITHGGMNSLNEAIYYGVPLIVIPQDADQPFNALRVAELNLGITLKMRNAKHGLYEMAKQVIEDEEIKKQMKCAQIKQQSAGGIQKAADYIEVL